jgi:hypothetical protein
VRLVIPCSRSSVFKTGKLAKDKLPKLLNLGKLNVVAFGRLPISKTSLTVTNDGHAMLVILGQGSDPKSHWPTAEKPPMTSLRLSKTMVPVALLAKYTWPLIVVQWLNESASACVLNIMPSGNEQLEADCARAGSTLKLAF